MNHLNEIKINWIEQEGVISKISTAGQTKFSNKDLLHIKLKLNELDEMLAQLSKKLEKAKGENNTTKENKNWYLDKSVFQKCLC